jgi:hypothetical protein
MVRLCPVGLARETVLGCDSLGLDPDGVDAQRGGRIATARMISEMRDVL